MMLKYLIRKEFLQMSRDAFVSRLIVFYPLIIMCVMPWVMNSEIKNITVDVVDNDRSTTSRHLVSRIEASNYFLFGGQKASYQEGLTDIESCKADVVAVIPQNYERDITNRKIPQVLIAANAVNGTKGSLGAAYLSNIVADNLQQANNKVEETISTLNLYNPKLDYKVFMIPALMGVLLMMMCGFLPALNIVGEKEKGTIEQMNVTPVSKWAFILAKLIPYWIAAILILSICFVLSWLVYGITSEGNLGYVYLIAMLLAFVFSGIGLIISNYSDNMQQAMFVMWFVVVCIMLLSGLFTPVQSMPHWAQVINYVNPMHYFIDAIRTVFIRGGDFASIAKQVYILGGSALFFGLWAVFSYRKNS